MASTLTRNNVSFPVGTQPFAIDSLPNNSAGFDFTMLRDATWDAAGHLFDFDIDLSADGIAWVNCVHGNMEGGPAGINPKTHVTETQVSWKVHWAVLLDSNGQPVPDRKTQARIVFNTARAFTSPQVTLAVFF